MLHLYRDGRSELRWKNTKANLRRMVAAIKAMPLARKLAERALKMHAFDPELNRAARKLLDTIGETDA